MQGLQDFSQGKGYLIGKKIFFKCATSEVVQVKDNSGVLLKRSPDYSKRELLQQASSFITLKHGVTEILFYYSLLPIVSMFLGVLGIFPNMILVITGRMGNFKTTLARIVTFILEQEELQEVPFYLLPKTKVLEEKMKLLTGMNLLIDDVFLSATQYGNNRKADLLNIIARYGDKKWYKTGIIITAEQMPEKLILSGRDRIFQLDIPDLKSEEKAELWKKCGCIPDYMMAQVSECFVQSLMENYDSVIKDIEYFLQKYQYPEGLNADTRIADHVKYMQLVEFLYRKYMCNGDEAYSAREQFESVLYEKAVRQHKEIRFAIHEQKIDYVREIYKMLNSDNMYLVMVSNRRFYAPDGKNFLIEYGRYYVTGSALYYGMIKYLGRTISRKVLSDALFDAGVLETDNSGGRTQKTYWNRRHYVISRQVIEAYCDISDKG